MANKSSLRAFLQKLKKKGLSNKEIADHLVRKGVDHKKAAMVIDAYLGGESESFSDLIQDIKIQKFTEEELEEIKKSLKGDLYHEESGLKIYGKPQQEKEASAAPAQREELKEAAKPTPAVAELEKEALSEIQALRKEVTKKSARKGALDNRIDALQQEITQLKEENSRLSSEIKRIDGEMDRLRELTKELINAVKEVRGMLA